MAGRKFKNVHTLEHRHVIIAGTFDAELNVATLNSGSGVAVSYNGVGDYTLTLTDQYPTLISAQVSLEVPTGIAAAVHGVHVGAVDMAAKTVEIRVWAATSDVLANITDADVHFVLHLSNSTL